MQRGFGSSAGADLREDRRTDKRRTPAQTNWWQGSLHLSAPSKFPHQYQVRAAAYVHGHGVCVRSS